MATNNRGKVTISQAASAVSSTARDAKNAVGTVTKKVGDKAEVAKIAIDIGKQEKQIEKLYMDIGKMMYSIHIGAVKKADYNESLGQIDACNAAIKELKLRSADIRGMQICTGCGRECSKEDSFCSKCGGKLPLADQPAQAEQKPEEAKTDK